MDYRAYKYITYPISKKIFKWKKPTDDDPLDADVLAEKENILKDSARAPAVLLKGVRKYFKKFIAVQDLYLGNII